MPECKYRVGDTVQFECFGRQVLGTVREINFHDSRAGGYWVVTVFPDRAVECVIFNVTLFPNRLHVITSSS